MPHESGGTKVQLGVKDARHMILISKNELPEKTIDLYCDTQNYKVKIQNE